MKVLLTQDVYKLGHAGEVKTIADGYGRNYLIPQGMAVLATAGALKRADALKSKAVLKRAAESAEVEAMAQVIGSKTYYFNAKTGEKGKLYGSITAAQIAEKISAALGAEFDKRKVELREPIREVGTHQVTVRLSAEVTPKIAVVVAPLGVVIQEAAPAAETAESSA
ncbi:MAG: 50S ribosomal protein L9 [Anaerolineae bacterium]|nr:50S ribosomal protein L9 [Anaerolineae bacterium]